MLSMFCSITQFTLKSFSLFPLTPNNNYTTLW